MKKLLEPYMNLPRPVYIIFFSRMINAAGLFIFPLLTLILTKKIGLKSEETGFIIMLVGLIFIPANLIGGKLTDLYGRKKLIVGFETIGGLLYILCGFLEPSMLQVYLILTASFFFGMAEPANTSLIADVTTPENRAGAYSLSYLGFNVGFAIGPILGGLLFESHYAWIFFGDAFSLLIAVALVAFLVPETFSETQKDLGESRALEQGRGDSIIHILLERPVLLVFSAILLLYNFAYSQWHFLLPIQSEALFPGGGAEFFGILASVNGITVMIFTPILTALLAKRTELQRVFIGGLLYLVGFGGLGFVSSKVMIMLCAFIFTLGEILVTISYMPFVANQTPASHRGRMNAIVPLIMGIGYSIGPLLMGNWLKTMTIAGGWHIISGILLAGVILMLLLERVMASKIKTNA